jgi:hypothetical protein
MLIEMVTVLYVKKTIINQNRLVEESSNKE